MSKNCNISWLQTFLVLSIFCVTTFGLTCYNGCGLKSENSAYCVQHANAYLAVNEYSQGRAQLCPNDSTVCADIQIWVPDQHYSFTIRGCDTPESCVARNEMWSLKYSLPDLGQIQQNSCCPTDLCNGAKAPFTNKMELLLVLFTLVLSTLLPNCY